MNSIIGYYSNLNLPQKVTLIIGGICLGLVCLQSCVKEARAAAAVTPVPSRPFVFAWSPSDSYLSGTNNVTYWIVGSTNLTQSASNWPVVGVLSNKVVPVFTNQNWFIVGPPGVSNYLSTWPALADTNQPKRIGILVSNIMPEFWFTVRESNSFWLSDFPAAVSTLPVPAAPTSLGLSVGP